MIFPKIQIERGEHFVNLCVDSEHTNTNLLETIENNCTLRLQR